MPIFTRSELGDLKIVALIRLAEYYKIKTEGVEKEQLVDELYNHFLSLDVRVVGGHVQNDEPQMSVRIRRIKESVRND